MSIIRKAHNVGLRSAHAHGCELRCRCCLALPLELSGNNCRREAGIKGGWMKVSSRY